MVLNPVGLESQVQLGPWVCFHESSPPHTAGFTRMDGEGNNEGNFIAPFYFWRIATVDISPSCAGDCAAFSCWPNTDFLR